jgi:hypothetical protein
VPRRRQQEWKLPWSLCPFKMQWCWKHHKDHECPLVQRIKHWCPGHHMRMPALPSTLSRLRRIFVECRDSRSPKIRKKCHGIVNVHVHLFKRNWTQMSIRTPSTHTSSTIEAFQIENSLCLKDWFVATNLPSNKFDATHVLITWQQEKIIRQWPIIAGCWRLILDKNGEIDNDTSSNN